MAEALSSRGGPLPEAFADAIADVRGRLAPLGRRFEYFLTTGSTNDIAASHAAAGDHEGAVFVAAAQTAGRGRRGRTWFSPPGAGLYVSTILRPARANDRERATHQRKIRFSKSTQMRLSLRQSYVRQTAGRCWYTPQRRVPGSLCQQ